MKIVILDSYTANPGDLSWEPLRALGDLTIYERTVPEDIVSHIGDANIVLTNKVPITATTLDTCPSIHFICETATGYNNVDVSAAKERGIPVSNVPSYSTASVSQLVFSLLLEIAQHVAAHSDAVHAGRWNHCEDFSFRDYPLFELAEKTLGIIGYGTIGQKVAKIAVSFGMHVLACSRTYRPELSTDQIKIVTQDEVLKDADIITLHCPENEESQGLINQKTIAQMKDGVIIINTARGGIVVEKDIVHALDSEKIYWYAADVLSVEPPWDGNVLIGAPRTLLTPHIAWMTTEARIRLMSTVRDNVSSFLEGAPINVVNP